MAITAVDHYVYSSLKHAGLIPSRPSVLELGEAEWYGDLSAEKLGDMIRSEVEDAGRRARLEAQLAELLQVDDWEKSWQLAKLFYAVYLDYAAIAAIDFHGTPAAMQIDLNYPVALEERYDVLINGGTAEHVFNVFQFFKTSHDLTRPGGLMVHSAPFRGWLDHGFYNFNPTFFWDLAAANGYSMLMLVHTEMDPLKLLPLDSREKIVDLARAGDLGPNAILFAVFRKGGIETEFATPAQGFYSDAVSKKMTQAWYEMR